MLRAFAWLVSNVALPFGSILNRRRHDWHTDAASEDQHPISNDITSKGPQLSQASFSGKASGRIPGIPVASPQGTTTYSHCAYNQDVRHEAEHDTVGLMTNAPKALMVSSARSAHPSNHEGGLTSPATIPLSFRAKAQRAAVPVPRSDTHSLI